MKPRTQMAIGLLTAGCLCIGFLASAFRRPPDLSDVPLGLVGLSIPVIYIIGIVKRKLTMARIVYFFCLISGVAGLVYVVASAILRGMRTEFDGEFALVVVLSLIGAVQYGFLMLLLGLGLRGLRRSVQAQEDQGGDEIT